MFTETELTAAQMQDLASQRPVANFQSRFGDDEPRKGCDVLVEALERQGVDTVFAYPGGASMEIHQALTRAESNIRNILCRHEQGEIFAAEGYAKVRRRDAHAHTGIRARTRTRARTPTHAHTHSLCSYHVDAGVPRRMR